MFHYKGIFVVLLLTLAQLTSAGSHTAAARRGSALEKRTNAARMAAGLSPLPPPSLKARTFGPGYPGHPQQPGHPGWPQQPTKPNPPKPGPSSHPGKPDCDDKHNVPIKCKRKGGGYIGYVSKNYSTKNNKRGYGLTTSKNNALIIDFNNEVTPFDAKIPSAKDFPYLGFSGNNLGPGESSVLTGTRKTNIHSGPSNVGNAFTSHSANSESQIWSYSRNDKKVTAQWINTGGNKPTTTLVYNPDDDLFHLVNDLNSFKKKAPRCYEVELEIDD